VHQPFELRDRRASQSAMHRVVRLQLANVALDLRQHVFHDRAFEI
jgi:hypothetical protein